MQNSKPIDAAKILHEARAEFAQGFSSRLSWTHLDPEARQEAVQAAGDHKQRHIEVDLEPVVTAQRSPGCGSGGACEKL